MLKPKRKITRKEIQKDPFLESIFSFKEHFESKKQLYYKIILSVIAVFIIDLSMHPGNFLIPFLKQEF